MKVEVFDVDGTLIEDNIGVSFVKYLGNVGAIKPIPKIAVILGYAAYKAKIVGFETAIRLSCYAMAGLHVEKVSLLAADCFEKIIRPVIYQEALDEIRKLQAGGHKVILATGAHEAIAKPFSDFVGADILVCTRSVVKDGRYTWSKLGEIPYKARKRDLVARAIREMSSCKETYVTVYTDDEKDIALFDLADFCVGVNASPEVRRLVESRHGEVKSFS